MAKVQEEQQINTESAYTGDFTAIASGYANIWMGACTLQVARILDESNRDQSTNLADCAMLVIAFNNLSNALYRYAEFLGTPAGKRRVPPHYYRARKYVNDAWLLTLKAVPQLRTIRNVISHFDEYAFGEREEPERLRWGNPHATKSHAH